MFAFYKLLIVILISENSICLEFGKLTIGKSDNKNEVELKSNNPSKSKEVLIANFSNANISNAHLNTSSKTAQISFARDQSAKNTFASVEEVENDQKIAHYSINWINPNPNEEFCVHFGGNQQWYSTYAESKQRWPLDKSVHFGSAAVFSTHDFFSNVIGGVIEYLFLGSDGFAVFVDRSAPLLIRRDSNSGNALLCFSANYRAKPYTHAIDTKQTQLLIHLISGNDIKHVHQYVAKRWFKKPVGIPDERMIKYPIWSTWAKYHQGITQDRVLEFAKEITSHGLPSSQLEIDDKWEVHYGDFTFDTKKFPNPHEMVKQLHSMGYRVSLWVYPFINTDCEAFKTGTNYFVKDNSGKVLLQKWWNGEAAHIDFTNSDARNWFVSRLQHIKNTTEIDSFKFDAGELSWVNTDFHFSDQLIQETPSVFSQLYSETAAKLGNMIEVRVGYNSQDLPIFIRMLDKLSGWGYDNGLKTLIPAALTMSIAGYPFILPDMIGGNAYGNFPSKELYIRWLQVNALMPTLQFSITPWDFKDSAQEVVNITKSMLKLHEQYTPLMIELAHNAVNTGEPILRPLWWVAPNDENTYSIDDEFLVGNDLLVAPVTTDKMRKRDIYLPSGNWKDHKGVEHKGGQTLKDFSVNLDELPYFVRT